MSCMPMPLAMISLGMSRVMTEDLTALSNDDVTASAIVPAMIAGRVSTPAADRAARAATTRTFQT